LKRFDCTVIGDVFIDIPAKVNFDPKRFFLGGTSYCDFVKPMFGGSGNVAVGISQLAGSAAFIGKAGNDAFGKLYEQDLKAKGVSCRMFFDRRLPTGLILAFVQRRERSFIVSRGANDQLLPEEIEKAKDLLRKSSFVYFCGYSLVRNPQRTAILKAIRLSRKFGAKIVFDPGAFNLVISEREFFTKLLDFCDVISLNVDEAKALTKKNSHREIVNEIGEKVPLTVLRCGARGSVICEDGRIIRTSGCVVKSTDTTGAGDAFTSALIYGLARQLPLELTGQLANWFAAQVTRTMGARGFPSKARIERFSNKLYTQDERKQVRVNK
jgi:hypothetical protein